MRTLEEIRFENYALQLKLDALEHVARTCEDPMGPEFDSILESISETRARAKALIMEYDEARAADLKARSKNA